MQLRAAERRNPFSLLGSAPAVAPPGPLPHAADGALATPAASSSTASSAPAANVASQAPRRSPPSSTSTSATTSFFAPPPSGVAATSHAVRHQAGVSHAPHMPSAIHGPSAAPDAAGSSSGHGQLQSLVNALMAQIEEQAADREAAAAAQRAQKEMLAARIAELEAALAAAEQR